MTTQSTQIDKFPKIWKIDRVDSVFEIQQGKQVSQVNRIGNNQRSFLRTKNVFWGRIELSELDQMNFTETEELRLTLKPNDLLMCEGGDIGRTALWDRDIQRCYYQNHLHRLRTINKQAHAQFFAYWFWYAFVNTTIYSGRANVTTIPNLSRSRLAELPVVIPPLTEQKKIAHILSTVQRAIQAQEQIIQTTTELFKAMLHQLMTAQIRVANGDGAKRSCEKGQRVNASFKNLDTNALPPGWSADFFGNLVDYKLGKTPPRGNSIYWENGKYPWVSISDMTPHGVVTDTAEKVSQEAYDDALKGKFIPKGSLLMSFKLTIGRISQLGIAAFHNEAIISFQPNPKTLNADYLRYYLSQINYKNYQDTAIKGQTLNRSKLNALEIAIPPLPEQKKIAHILSTIQQKTHNAQSKKSKLETLFRTLLHELMTAKIRVNSM